MPTYDYACEDGHTHEHFRTIAERHNCPACPTCGKPTTKQIATFKTEIEYTETMGESRAFRFPASGVDAARRSFSSVRDGSVRVRDDGAVVFKNRSASRRFADEWATKSAGSG